MTSQPVRPAEVTDLPSLLESLHVVRIPLSVRFRGVTEREVALIRGPRGWGEFSPFLEYGPQEASTWLAAAIEAAHLGMPEPRRTEIPVNITVPAVGPERVESVLRRYGEDWLTEIGQTGAAGRGVSIKVKVAEKGQSLEDDLARLAEVRRLAPGARVRVDANMGWGAPERLRTDAAGQAPEDVSRAVEALTRLAEFDLQYAEQPVATVAGLREVRRQLAGRGVDLKIAADESIRRGEDPISVAREEAADVVVVKYAPLGGARRALEVIEACGLPAVVSSALDTSVGLSAGLGLAAALPSLPYACGLGTLSLAEEDVAVEPLRLGAGSPGEHRHTLPVGVPEVDGDQLARLAVSAERREHWERRLRECWAALER